MASHPLRTVALMSAFVAGGLIAWNEIPALHNLLKIPAAGATGAGSGGGGTSNGPVTINGSPATDLGGFPVVWKNGVIIQDPSRGGTNTYKPGVDVFKAGGLTYLWTGGTSFSQIPEPGTDYGPENYLGY